MKSPTTSSVRERLLLHWINSLPLTECLLVENLRDLRFGDVLYEVVQWLQGTSSNVKTHLNDATIDSEFENDAVVERLGRVVHFVASECRSHDGDAMYIVNNAECAAQVMAGQSDAICAVLTVLKRLSVQRMESSDKDDIHRRQLQRKLRKHFLQQALHVDTMSDKIMEHEQHCERVQPPCSRAATHRPKPSKNVGRASIPRPKVKVVKRDVKVLPTKAKRNLLRHEPVSRTTASPSVMKESPDIVRSSKGLRVFGMLDPTVKASLGNDPSSTKCPSKHPNNDNARAAHFCNWARLALHVEMPLEHIFAKRYEDWRLSSPSKYRQVFSSGDVLCRLALAIVQRFRGRLDKRVFQTNECSLGDTFAPSNDPDVSVRRRHNFSFALSVFQCLGISSKAFESLESLQRPGKQPAPKMLWSALAEVLDRVERLASNDASSSKVQDTRDTTISRDHKKSVSRSPHAVRSQHVLSSQSALATMTASGIKMTRTECATSNRSLPYITMEQMQAVNKWLTEAGFSVENMTSRHGVLQDPMRNGVLLCALLIQVLKCTPFSYFKAPRTLAEMRENIAKAFERLAQLPHEQIPQCYLTSSAEQAVLINDRQLSYGLLWHLWQASHAKVDMTKAHKGRKVSSISRSKAQKVDAVLQFGKESPTQTQKSPLLLDIPAVNLAGRGERTIQADPESFQVTLHDDFARRLAQSENSQYDVNDDDDVFPVPKAPASSPVYTNDLDPASAEFHETQTKYQPVDDILPARSHEAKSVVLVPSIVCPRPAEAPKQERLLTFSPTKVSTAETIESHDHIEEILAWLKHLGITLTNANAFRDSNAKLTEFQSGELLCSIVERVEFMRSIPGVTRASSNQSLNKASALHNISKALKILQQKKTMPLHLIRRANSIYAGDRDLILRLLLQIRKAYGHHHRHYSAPLQRIKQPSTAA